MAARLSRSEIDFSCPICQEVFKDPVLLSCSHSFCKACLQSWWAEKLIRECPVCKRRSSKSDPPRNLALKNLCEAFSQELSLEEEEKPSASRSESLCSLHSEKLKLFCLDHQQPVCVVCRDAKTHSNHRFRPIDEAAEDYKEELRKSLKPLQDKLERLTQVKENWEQTEKYIIVQSLGATKQIGDEFEMLEDFLQKEEQVRLAAVWEERKEKEGVMRQKIEALSREITALTDTVRAAEKELTTGSVSFLQNYKAAVGRVQQRPLLDDPQLSSGALIDTAKHLGNLTYNIWNKMKDIVTYSPVILDPNTACPGLSVSEDLTSVTYGERDTQRPLNPERFEDYPTVLGSEGFTSGTHSWEVEVGIDEDWAVGVAAESVQRKGEIPAGFWGIWFRDGEYRVHSPHNADKVLSDIFPISLMMVQLDMDRGELSFCNMDIASNIHTFSHRFSEKLFPYFYSLDTSALRILTDI